ncbi:rhamnan synthesis F family protein [Brachyspira pulli]|uniref:rhamnan synthesis F family protein n=1 Tax=Brachyspira pulli TaxID=310721 RepID=UPI0030047AE1
MKETKRLAIFAGYDKDNIIDDYVVYYIKELKKVADIIYVSDCNISDSELEKISSYCIHIINGRHGEYDFGSYKRGYIYAKEKDILKDYDYIILCNDSVFGPIFNLEEIVKNIENKNTDVWGIFKSLKDSYYDDHLQSYFISIKQKVYISAEFYNFILSIKKESDKNNVIAKYEIGLSQLFKENNYSISYFLDSSLNLNLNRNTPLFDPYISITNGFPFLKTYIFKHYMYLKQYGLQMNIKKLKNLIKIISKHYDIQLIIDYLLRIDAKIPRLENFNKCIISKKLLYIDGKYINDYKYQIFIIIFNFINITINIPKKFLYYSNFNFLIKR